MRKKQKAGLFSKKRLLKKQLSFYLFSFPVFDTGTFPWSKEKVEKQILIIVQPYLGCIKNSRGALVRRRECKIPKPAVSATQCQGPTTEVQLCDNYASCDTAEISATEYATAMCKDYQNRFKILFKYFKMTKLNFKFIAYIKCHHL
jgi:hypothetical protein